MPEASLHSPGQRKADTVVAQPVLTEYQALRHEGWVQGIDFLLMTLIALTLVTLFFWWFFGTPTQWNVLFCLVAVVLLFQVWAILLVLRCARFVLRATAYMHTLPEDAARIVMAAYSGGRR